jgi:hypothetical protein
MRGLRTEERGISLLLEYIILIGILSSFAIITGLYLKDTLEKSQVERVLENQLTDSASVIASQLTDYSILAEDAKKIESKITTTKSIGDVEFFARFETYDGKVYIKLVSEDGKVEYTIPFGPEELQNFVVENSTIHSLQQEKKLELESTVVCNSPIRVTIDVDPDSIAFESYQSVSDYINHTITLEKFETGEPVGGNWTLYLWNGSIYYGSTDVPMLRLKYYWMGDDTSDWSGTNCTYDSSTKTAVCNVTVYAESWSNEFCNDTVSTTVILSKEPEDVEPFLEFKKFAKPEVAEVGKPIEIHIRLEGKGFAKEASDLTAVQVIDVSGSMDWDSEYADLSSTANPTLWTVEFNITSSDVGKTLRIEAWTTSSDITNLTDNGWYSSYSDSYILMYLDGNEVGSSIPGSLYGKRYSQLIESEDIGNHTVSVIARAPDTIKLYLRIKIGGSVVFDNSTYYTSTVISRSFYLPSDRTSDGTYDRLKVTASTDFDAWLEDPNGDKYKLYSSGQRTLYNVPPGQYQLYAVPKTKDSTSLTAKAYIKRIEAAKIASIYFNNLEGVKYVGLARFSTDSYSYELNGSTALTYLTTDKSAANDVIKGLTAGGATDHYDGLYAGYIEFPNESASENNCTECLRGTIPLLILLSDGETTACNPSCDESCWDYPICNGYTCCDYSYFRWYYGWYCCVSECTGSDYYPCWCACTQCDGGYQCVPGAEKAKYIANIIKNTQIIPDDDTSKIQICTIGFGTSLSSWGQQFLEEIASPRPDNGNPCYFYATGYEELSDAFEAIYKAYRIAAKNITVFDTVNNSITVNPYLQYIDGSLRIYLNGEDKTSEYEYTVNDTAEGTKISVNISGISIDDVVEIVFKVLPQKEGEYDLNVEAESYVSFEKYPFGPSNRVTVSLGSAGITVTTGSGKKVKLT